MLTIEEARNLIENDLERAQRSAAFLGKEKAFAIGYLKSKLVQALIKIDEQKQIINEINQINNF